MTAPWFQVSPALPKHSAGSQTPRTSSSFPSFLANASSPQKKKQKNARRLNALLESSPSLPPSLSAANPPLLPTALSSGVDICSHLLHFERKIFLWGHLTDDLAAAATAQLLLLHAEVQAASRGRRGRPTAAHGSRAQNKQIQSEGERIEVELIVNSKGGSLTAGLALYDVLSVVSSCLKVKTFAVGAAGHLAALLVGAGEKGERRATRHARIFLCESTAHAQGSAHELLSQAASLGEQEDVFVELLNKHTGQPISKIQEWAKRTRVFTPEEAQQMGLIDEVVAGSFDRISSSPSIPSSSSCSSSSAAAAKQLQAKETD
ncbi:hypothetical protein Efla_000427 [Eimeria flavescens]